MPFSDSYANNILDYALAKTASLSAPSAVYIGLCTNDPEADGGTFNELSGGGYARVLIATKGGSYPDVINSAAARSILNGKQINWTKATADWATANGFGLFTTPTGGTPFFYGKLESPVTCEAGEVALFDPQSFKISFPETDTTV